jgi:hypothetical protein
MVSFAGSMITYVAIPYQVYQLTRSSLAVGLLGAAELAPLLATGPLLGNLEAGAVAAAFGVRVSVVSGGLLSLVGAGVVALLMPVFRAYDAARWSARNQPGQAPAQRAGKGTGPP